MTDSLIRARRLAAEARDLQAEIKDLEERVSLKKEEVREILEKKLPDIMSEARVTRFDLQAEGNHLPVEVTLKPFYAASISSEWPQHKRDKAFSYLRERKAGDLIRVEVTFSFSKGDDVKAQRFIKAAVEKGWNPTVKETVHHATLSSWLKECIETGEPMPDLEIIGGRVGQVAKLK